MDAPKIHRALMTTSNGFRAANAFTLECAAGQVLIRVTHASLEREDLPWLFREGAAGLIGGLNCAGYVVQQGQGVDRQRFPTGTKIVALVQPSQSNGAFSEYAVVDVDFAWPCPPTMHVRNALASTGTSALLASLCLYHYLGLPSPERQQHPQPCSGLKLAVLNADCGFGSACVQLSKAAGMQVAVTVSSDPGAQVLDKDIIRISSEAQAKEWAQGSIFAVVQCQALISNRDDVETAHTYLKSVAEHTQMSGTEGEADRFLSPVFCAEETPQKRAAKGWLQNKVSDALSADILKPGPFEIEEGGLAKANTCLQNMRSDPHTHCRYIFKVD